MYVQKNIEYNLINSSALITENLTSNNINKLLKTLNFFTQKLREPLKLLKI